MKINIEVNCNERQPFYEIMDLDYSLPSVVGHGAAADLVRAILLSQLPSA